MKILVAPLNWGLGHASRCVPLVRRLLDEGHEVVLGGDGESMTLLRRHFPKLRYVYLAPLHLQYSKGSRQVWAMLKALPRLLLWALKDHMMLKAVLREETFDQVISDNRFGLYSVSERSERSVLCQTKPVCIYMTHQLHIMLPKGWRWAEKIASRLHARVYARFNKVWVPDYDQMDKSLAGELSHPSTFTLPHAPLIEYIGPLSRFSLSGETGPYDVVAVLSGLEPQRTLLEQEIMTRYKGRDERVLIVQGLMNRPNTRFKRGNFTIVPSMRDEELLPALLGAKHIIARSGYSTIMDMEALGLLSKTELIPTPGQPEQEYLAKRIKQKTLFS